MIRNATIEDLPVIQSILDEARETMIECGNTTQWPKGYPAQSVLETDIETQTGYIIEEEGVPVAYFAFKPSPDPTYNIIYEGAWLDTDSPYYVIHRVACRRTVHGVFKKVLDFCSDRTNNIRIDTHRNNTIMQHLVAKHGFTYCGIIHLLNGDERLAYQRIR